MVQKEETNKRWKETIEKGMVDRSLKRSDAQDRAVWRLGCVNWPTPIARKTSWVPETLSLLLSTLLQEMDDDNVLSFPSSPDDIDTQLLCRFLLF